VHDRNHLLDRGGASDQRGVGAFDATPVGPGSPGRE
jgi:hypothetical protein